MVAAVTETLSTGTETFPVEHDPGADDKDINRSTRCCGFIWS